MRVVGCLLVKSTKTVIYLGMLTAIAACSDPTTGKPAALVEDAGLPAATSADGASAELAPGIVDRFSQPQEGSRPKPKAGSVKTYVFGEGSRIEFVASKVTRSHTGGFGAFAGEVRVYDGDLERAEIEAAIDIASIYTDEPDLTAHLKTPDFFDVVQHPKAAFESIMVSKTDAGYDISGELTLHGVTKRITFPAAVRLDGDMLDASAEFSINRQDFGISYPGLPDDLIRDNVLLRLKISAQAAPETDTSTQ